jgi:TRAP-type C4-dicarboxylate transport system substrate-binding protein
MTFARQSRKPHLLAILGATLFVAPAAAQGDKIVLRVADSLPASHEVVRFATSYFMETVTKETGNQVTFEYFGSEQLGKARDILNLTVAGAADIGYVAPSLVPEKMPLGEVALLPGLFNDACDGTKAFYKLATAGILAQNEFKANGVRALFVVLQPPNALFLSRQDPSDLKNVQNLKIRSTGGAQDMVIKSLKAVPIRTTGPELYESLSRGTVDGMVVSYASLLSYSWIDVVKYATLDQSFGSFAFTYTISETRWQKLPPNVQQALTKVGAATTERACALMQKDIEPTLAKLRERGLKLAPLDARSQSTLEETLAGVSKEWAVSLDRRGKAGTRALEEFKAALK